MMKTLVTSLCLLATTFSLMPSANATACQDGLPDVQVDTGVGVIAGVSLNGDPGACFGNQSLTFYDDKPSGTNGLVLAARFCEEDTGTGEESCIDPAVGPVGVYQDGSDVCIVGVGNPC